MIFRKPMTRATAARAAAAVTNSTTTTTTTSVTTDAAAATRSSWASVVRGDDLEKMRQLMQPRCASSSSSLSPSPNSGQTTSTPSSAPTSSPPAPSCLEPSSHGSSTSWTHNGRIDSTPRTPAPAADDNETDNTDADTEMSGQPAMQPLYRSKRPSFAPTKPAAPAMRTNSLAHVRAAIARSHGCTSGANRSRSSSVISNSSSVALGSHRRDWRSGSGAGLRSGSGSGSGSGLGFHRARVGSRALEAAKGASPSDLMSWRMGSVVSASTSASASTTLWSQVGGGMSGGSEWYEQARLWHDKAYQPGLIISAPFLQMNEISGRGGDENPENIALTAHGLVYLKPRPMVVVETYKYHCVCIPCFSHRRGGLNGKPEEMLAEFIALRDADDPMLESAAAEAESGYSKTSPLSPDPVLCRSFDDDLRRQLEEHLAISPATDAARFRPADIAAAAAATTALRSALLNRDGPAARPAISAKTSLRLSQPVIHDYYTRCNILGHLTDVGLVRLQQALNWTRVTQRDQLAKMVAHSMDSGSKGLANVLDELDFNSNFVNLQKHVAERVRGDDDDNTTVVNHMRLALRQIASRRVSRRESQETKMGSTYRVTKPEQPRRRSLRLSSRSNIAE